MNDVAVGRQVQDVRISKNLRQSDVAARAGTSRQMVSRLERGLLEGMMVSTLRAISRALGMPPLVTAGWRIPEVDRLRDRVHAAMVECLNRRLQSTGWELAPESSFNHYGEHGSADILAWHPQGRALLIVETKSRLWDVQDTLVSLDRKRRVMPSEAQRRFGWRPAVVGVVLVMPDLSTHRHVVARHGATFRAVLPHGTARSRHWLGDPTGSLRGILFLPISQLGDIGRRSLRKRARPTHPKRPAAGSPHLNGGPPGRDPPTPGTGPRPNVGEV